jgi:pimeloyl-ACP methyl ester carboxylesterase
VVILVAALLPVVARAASADLRTIAVGPGETLTVSVEGNGPAVVLLPGLLGSSFAYRNVAPRLCASGHRVVIVEPLGVGSSSRPPRADYSLTAQADRIARVLEALQIDDAIVVGHSVAASMALRLACRHPERVRAVVALEGGPAETVATPGLRLAMRFAPLLKLFGGTRIVRGR